MELTQKDYKDKGVCSRAQLHIVDCHQLEGSGLV